MKYFFLTLVVVFSLVGGKASATETWKSKTAFIQVESDGSGVILLPGTRISLAPGGWRMNDFEFQAMGVLSQDNNWQVMIHGYVFESGNITFEYLGRSYYVLRKN